MKIGTGILLLLASGAAIACTVIGGASFSINMLTEINGEGYWREASGCIWQ